MLFIPANSSATAVYQVLGDNGGIGLMFETEGDTQTYTETATAPGINPRTADSIIHRWCDTGQLENVSHGKYRKKV